MSLFVINRYTGSDETTDEALKRSASDGLKELQRKAKQRKKDKINEIKQIESQSKSEDQNSPHKNATEGKIKDKAKDESKKKTKKKAKLKDNTVVDEKLNNENEIVVETMKAKSKNKTKKKVKLKDERLVDDEKINDENELGSETKVDELNNSSRPDTKNESVDEKTEKSDLEESKTSSTSHGGKEIGGFTMLGDDVFGPRKKVVRKLPGWLANPCIVKDVRSDDASQSFKGIDEILIDNLKNMGIIKPFPVQTSLIPAILRDTKFGVGVSTFRPNDICVSAPTGSGKTVAFALPIIQSLLHRVVPTTRALVVLPTRELASQVFQVFITLCGKTPLTCGLINGSTKNLSQERKVLINIGKNGIISQADIVVATPGRLVEHLTSTEHFKLSQLRFLVIDEADRMMDHIKQGWLNAVESSVYQDRPKPQSINVKSLENPVIPLQKLLFSATLSADPEKLDQLNLFQPRLFTSLSRQPTHQRELHKYPADVERGFVGKYTTPEGLQEYMTICSAGEKPLVVLNLVLDLNRVLCFAGSLETTHRLALLIQLYATEAGHHDFTCKEFSSSLPPFKRLKVLKDFKAGKINVLVCSDSMARGMDIKGVSCVILYDVPSLIKTYIHRVGRTARAGEGGTSHAILRYQEANRFRKMISDAGKHLTKLDIPREKLEELTPLYQKVLPLVAEQLKCAK